MVVLGGQVISYERGIPVVRVAGVASWLKIEGFGFRV